MAEQEIIECPLKIGKTAFTDCTGSKCGFWSYIGIKCAIAVIGNEISVISSLLDNCTDSSGIRVRII